MQIGPNLPSAVASTDAGADTPAWSNVTRLTADDNSGASVVLNNQNSDYADSTGFGFAVPAGATILGIYVEIQKFSIPSGVADVVVQMLDAGSPVGDNKASATGWPNFGAVYISAYYGSQTDLWGFAWTAAKVNAADFGVRLQCTSPSIARTGFVDVVKVTVYYASSDTGLVGRASRRARVPHASVWDRRMTI